MHAIRRMVLVSGLCAVIAVSAFVIWQHAHAQEPQGMSLQLSSVAGFNAEGAKQSQASDPVQDLLKNVTQDLGKLLNGRK